MGSRYEWICEVDPEGGGTSLWGREKEVKEREAECESEGRERGLVREEMARGKCESGRGGGKRRRERRKEERERTRLTVSLPSSPLPSSPPL